MNLTLKDVRAQLSLALLILVVLGALAGCATGPRPGSGGAAAVATEHLPAPNPESAAGALRNAADYRIGPQDLLDISVFGVEELTRTVRVNATGQISLPLAGTIQAGGRTVAQLEADIGEKLQQGYLQSPQVTVFIKEYTSQRVTLEGAVRKPGIYPLMGKTSLIQAIATAEGLDPLANPQGIVVFRMIDGKKMAAVFDIRAIRSGQIEDPQIYGDDIIVVDQSSSKTALRRFIESVPALGVFALF